MGFYKNMEMSDVFPLNKLTHNPVLQWVQDLLCPFVLFIRCDYNAIHHSKEAFLSLEKATYKTEVKAQMFGKNLKKIKFEIEIKNDKVTSFKYYDNKKKVEAVCIE